jgi:hypothetical protein
MSIKVHETSMDYEVVNGIPTIYVSRGVLSELEWIKEFHESKREAFDFLHNIRGERLEAWIYNNERMEMNEREDYFIAYLDNKINFESRN